MKSYLFHLFVLAVIRAVLTWCCTLWNLGGWLVLCWHATLLGLWVVLLFGLCTVRPDHILPDTARGVRRVYRWVAFSTSRDELFWLAFVSAFGIAECLLGWPMCAAIGVLCALLQILVAFAAHDVLDHYEAQDSRRGR